MNQEVALRILRKLGLRANAVANGLEALAALQATPYDLILMDMQMPELDGLETTRRIRQPNSTVLNPRLPIIAMTANAMRGDRGRCLDAGMNDYIAKPVSIRTLAAALDLWLPAPDATEPHAPDTAGASALGASSPPAATANEFASEKTESSEPPPSESAAGSAPGSGAAASVES